MADQTVRRVSRVPKETAALDNTRRLPRRARMVLLVIWIGLLAVFCIAFWSKQRDEFATLGDLLGDIGLWWLLAALALVPLALALTVEIYHTLLRRLGAPVSRADVWRVRLRGLAVAMAGPFGGPSSIAVFVNGLAARGVSLGDGVLVVMLSSMVGYAAFIVLLVPLILLLQLEGRLPSSALGAAAGLAIAFGLLILALWRALRSPAPPWLQRRLPARLNSSLEHAINHRLRLRDFVWPCALAVAIDVVNAATLALLLAALGQPPPLTATLVGTEVGTLFTVIAPIFQGFGVVEVSLTVILERFGVPAVTALSATLLYRACSMWLPLLAGLLAVGGQALAWGVRRVLRRAPSAAGNRPPADH